MKSSPKLLTIEQVADRLAVDPKTVRKRVATRELAAFRIGRQWRISPDDLELYLLRQRNERRI
ncbi:MAG: helix-turn-helix domain-containing protein [Hyphomonadaceae bacterium]|nr:helix-turn-helix domain-containing protein [Hyphomonadaceae bacterium]